MTSQIRGLGAAVSNANDAISMVNTAEGALDEITAMLQRMRELGVQAATGTTDSADRTYLQSEFAALRSEIDRIVDNTQWNGRNILDGSAGASAGASTVAFGIGQDGTAAQTLSTSFGNFSDTDGKLSGLASKVITGTTIASAIATSAAAVAEIDVVIGDVSSQRATFGAVSNRLTHAVDNLTNVKTNSEEARSRILDTDYATATSELARTQIIQQAGTAMLAQANAHLNPFWPCYSNCRYPISHIKGSCRSSMRPFSIRIFSFVRILLPRNIMLPPPHGNPSGPPSG